MVFYNKGEGFMARSVELQRALEQVQQQYEINQEFTKGLSMMAGMDGPDGTSGPGVGIEVEEGVDASIEVEQVRGLGDIAKTTPQNSKEEQLLNKAQIFLSPSEFRGCVDLNSPAQEVDQKVGSIEMYNEIRQFMMREQTMDRKEEIEEQREGQEVAVDKDHMSLLSKEFSVLKEIGEAFNNTSVIPKGSGEEIEAPDTPNRESVRDQDQGRSR